MEIDHTQPRDGVTCLPPNVAAGSLATLPRSSAGQLAPAFDADVTFVEVDITEKSNLRIQYKRNEQINNKTAIITAPQKRPRKAAPGFSSAKNIMPRISEPNAPMPKTSLLQIFGVIHLILITRSKIPNPKPANREQSQDPI
jgi:hypothetical protein